MKSISRALLLAFILGLLAYAEETQEQQVDRLIRELQNSDSDIRSIAAVTLGEIGPEAKDAVPALIQALRDQDKHVRRDAAEALEEIGLPKAIKTAKERYRAVVTLGWIGSEDEVPALVRTLKNGNIHVPLFATWSLGVLRLMIVIGFIGISGALIITIWFVFLCGNTSFCAWKWDWTQGYHSAVKEDYSEYMGQTGVALTALRPAGTAMIDNKRLDVVSVDDFIEVDMPIQVVSVNGAKVTVEKSRQQTD